MSIKLTRDDLASLCPRPKKGSEAQKNWDGYIAALTSPDGYAVFEKFGIDTRMELCAFIANVAEETGDSGGFTALWENLSFSTVSAIRRAWHGRASRYSDSWIQKNLLGKPVALGDWAYGGRMGNGINNGDGYKYRGFGALQTTGKTDHLRYYNGDYSYLSSIRAALMEWKDKNCDTHIANGDFRTVCILINGGTNGLDLREAYFEKAKTIWTDDPDWSAESDPAVALDDSTDSITAGPSLIPDIVTASDLKGQSRKIDLLYQARDWLVTKLGLGSAGTGTYSLVDGLKQGHSAMDILRGDPLLAMSLLGVVFAAILGVVIYFLIHWTVEDHNDRRYIPSRTA